MAILKNIRTSYSAVDHSPVLPPARAYAGAPPPRRGVYTSVPYTYVPEFQDRVVAETRALLATDGYRLLPATAITSDTLHF
jgi:hypothetical protein